jgi:anti-sigma factor ChrR (cupin superfamily)
MKINANFDTRVMVHSDELDWIASPTAGVDRRMLDRIGDEVARATTIVRYAKNSKFPRHTHTGGEEFIVIDGVFQDEHGDFPTGSYVRNPPTTSHAPGSDDGCVIFVKLWQYDMADRTQIMIDMNKNTSVDAAGRAGVSVMPLFSDADETVLMETWAAGASVEIDLPKGGEFLVLEGGFIEGGDELRKHSWLRLPMGSNLSAVAGPKGAKVWMKTGHLPHAKPPKV